MTSSGNATPARYRRADSPRWAVLALLLLVPVPTLGTVSGMVLFPGPTGQVIFMVCKVWLLLFPVAWLLVVQHGKPSWSPPRNGGLGVGALSGAAVAVVIVLAYLLIAADRIDQAAMRATLTEIGLGSPLVYLGAAAYWIFVNSVIEEYVYRWFVFRQCERLMPAGAAVFVAALVFTAHHVVAMQVYLSPALTALASAGVFMGGVIWSWCYSRYRSIWPGWVSHAFADVAIFAIGWHLLFGTP